MTTTSSDDDKFLGATEAVLSDALARIGDDADVRHALFRDIVDATVRAVATVRNEHQPRSRN
jgi:hypothetical protein